MNINDILSMYQGKINHLELDLIFSHVIKKTREFILIHPEFKITKTQVLKIKELINRRLKHEPIAYILGEKEFYGLPFKVNKNTLIPRPETEQLVEQALRKIQDTRYNNQTIIDLGTGSGNIIISLVKNLESLKFRVSSFKFYGVDISSKALAIAKQNAKLNKVEKKIEFIKGNLLSPVISNPQSVIRKSKELIIVANLPYLSKEIYEDTMPDVKNFEPKSALYSSKEGLDHYEKLFSQIKKLKIQTNIFLEFSPEQKKSLNTLTKKYFPKAKLKFQKDLAGKWRILEVLT